MADDVATRREIRERPYMTLKEAAHHLGVSRHWFTSRIGKVTGPPVFRRGRVLLFPRGEFMEWARRKSVP